MPSLRPAVRIRVVDPRARWITNAVVTAFAPAYPAGIVVHYDNHWEVYTDAALVNGPNTLTVAAPGFVSQTRNAVFVGDSIETFVLFGRLLRWYYRGYVRVAYDLPHMVAVAMRHGHAHEIEKVRMIPQEKGLHRETFREPYVEETVHAQRVFVFEVPNDDAAIGNRFEELARSSPSVRAVGEVVQFTPRSVSFATNELVVKLRPGDRMPRLVAEAKLEVVRRIDYLDNTFLLRGRTSSDLVAITERLNEDKAVAWAEPNLFSTIVWHSNDPLFAVQPHHAFIDTPSAWSRPYGRGQRSRIAVLDDGCDTVHEDLASRVAAEFNFDNPGAPVDVGPDGHGTRAAGIAAGEVDNNKGGAGVAGLADLVPIQINASSHVGYGDMFIWCAGLPGAPTSSAPYLSPGADVLSNSWGVEGLAAGALSTTPGMGGLMADVFALLDQNARGAKGCVVVFSAGNDNAEFALLSPWAAYPTNLAVAASTTTAPEARVPNSNYSVELDVCAPAGGVPPAMQATTTTDAVAITGNAYGDFGETSCACPQVAGAAALILSVNPGITAEAVRALLHSTAAKIDDPPATGNPVGQYVGPASSPSRFSRWYGYGRIRVGSAVAAALET